MSITIRELSERSGVKVPTIRYYERQGLLPEPEKTGSGQRRYGSVDVARLRFVRFGRGLGLEVGEIRALIEMVGEGDGEAIVVLAEAVVDRAERLHTLGASLQSVSAAIVGGVVDEAGAFTQLVDSDRGVPCSEGSENRSNVGSERTESGEGVIASTDRAPEDEDLGSAAPEDGATKAPADARPKEKVTPETPCLKPVRKRARAKA